MIPFRVTLAQRPRRPPDFFAGPTPAPSSLLFLSTADQRFRFCRKGSPNSFAPHTFSRPPPSKPNRITLLQKHRGEGAPPIFPSSNARKHFAHPLLFSITCAMPLAQLLSFDNHPFSWGGVQTYS